MISEILKYNRCDTCSDRMVCGSANTELIQPDDTERLLNMGIKAIAIVYACDSWNQSNLSKVNDRG